MNQYIGRLLDNRYEILEIIGNGGMAVVYKALCHRLNRLVAVKILKDEFSGDEDFRRRFRAEGEAVAMLSHPNIVQVFDVSSSDNANYIVMELIDGISLKQYMEAKGVLNWKETLHFSMQIAKGLEHAHSRGIVHRDIKPHNVMVLKDGSVKVMDFGIARIMSKSSTLTKEALGSVHYISPEQARGSLTDNRSDLYSLGVVMYEMMAGRPPYDGESPVSVAIQHINGGAPRPSVYNPNIPLGLEQIILKAMALDPADRYSSATLMLQDMEEFRKNPAITFAHGQNLAATQQLSDISKVVPKTTAEKKAAKKGGTVRAPGNPANTGNIRNTGTAGTGRNTAGFSATGKTGQAQRRSELRRKEQQRQQQERSHMAAIAVICCSLVVLLAIGVFLVAIFNGALLSKKDDLVSVPQLIGDTYSDSLLEKYDGLSFRLLPQQYSDEFGKGQIMRQEPSGGSSVSRGTEVVITVSLGKEPNIKIMENLTGATEEEAKSFVVGQGFSALVKTEASSNIAPGKVIYTDPAVGTTLTEGQTITIYVSSGPEVTLQVMPDVVNLDKASAMQVLDGLGFRYVAANEVESQKPRGTVISQSVKKDEKVDITTQIILDISGGVSEVTTEQTTEPTAEATQPTQAATEIPTIPQPTEPNDGKTSLTVTFTVPYSNESAQLTILQGDEVVVSGVSIPAGTTTYNMQLRDSGTREYAIYIDGEWYSNQRVKFNNNG